MSEKRHEYQVTVTWQGNAGTGTSGYREGCRGHLSLYRLARRARRSVGLWHRCRPDGTLAAQVFFGDDLPVDVLDLVLDCLSLRLHDRQP